MRDFLESKKAWNWKKGRIYAKPPVSLTPYRNEDLPLRRIDRPNRRLRSYPRKILSLEGSVDRPDASDDPLQVQHRGNDHELRGECRGLLIERSNPEQLKLIQKYKLYQKIIDGKICVRLDYSADSYPDGKPRSCLIRDGKGTVFISGTNQVESRFSLDQVNATIGIDSSALASAKTLMGRIDVKKMVAQARSLAYDVTEQEGGKLYVLSAPSSLLTKMAATGHSIDSLRLYYDAEAGVLAQTEQVMTQEDGTTVTVTNSPVYQETETGEPIQAGSVLEVNNKKSPIDAAGEAVPTIAQEDTTPVVTAAELAADTASGKKVEQVEPIIGDPSDPSYTTTTITVYDDIAVNQTSDSVFRINL